MKKVIMVIKKLEAGVQTISVMFKQTVDHYPPDGDFFSNFLNLFWKTHIKDQGPVV